MVGSAVSIYQDTVVNVVDGKGRVSVPASYRKVLQARAGNAGEVVIGIHTNGKCLVGYDVQRLALLNARLEEDFAGTYDPAREAEREKLARQLNARTQTLKIDDQGRLLLPASFRAIAAIGERAVFVTGGSSFQIWSIERAKAELEADTPGLASMIDEQEAVRAVRK
jgi:MraZ protein